METMKVKKDNARGYSLINVSDFDANKHEPYDEAAATIAKSSDEQKQKFADLEAERQYNANRGQIEGHAPTSGQNPSGTFSEPTPTDIRYPNKQATEFENNLGAFINKSAAGLRREMGMPNRPGGIVGAIRIEGDWRRMNKDQQMELASKISGQSDLSIKQTKQILADEVRRRLSEGRDVTDGLTDEERAAEQANAGNREANEGEEPSKFDKMTGAQMDEYLEEEGIEEPDEWGSMKVAEKRAWLASR